MTTRWHARDIPDDVFLEVVRATRSTPTWALVWDVEQGLAERGYDAPRKVVLAKAKRLIGRGRLDGCACGCRGDFEVIEKEGVSMKDEELADLVMDEVLDRLWQALNEPGGEMVQPSEDEGEDKQGKHSGHQEDESPH